MSYGTIWERASATASKTRSADSSDRSSWAISDSRMSGETWPLRRALGEAAANSGSCPGSPVVPSGMLTRGTPFWASGIGRAGARSLDRAGCVSTEADLRQDADRDQAEDIHRSRKRLR